MKKQNKALIVFISSAILQTSCTKTTITYNNIDKLTPPSTTSVPSTPSTQAPIDQITTTTELTTVEQLDAFVHHTDDGIIFENGMSAWDTYIPEEAEIVKVMLESNINKQPVEDWSKVLFIGDSITCGLQLQAKNTEASQAHFMCQGGIGTTAINTLLNGKPNSLKTPQINVPSSCRTLIDHISTGVEDIFIGLGTNDLWLTEQGYKDNITNLIDNIHTTYPHIKIHIWNIKPCKSGSYKNNIEPFNEVLKNICLEKNLHYVDVYSDTKHNISWLSDEGIHMTSKGYINLLNLIIKGST